jgi:nitrogen regulatory protein PII
MLSECCQGISSLRKRHSVKKVEAIVTPYILDAVREVLAERGCREIVLSEVRISNQDNPPAIGRYRGNACEIALTKLKVEAIVSDADAMPMAQAILRISKSESAPDTKVSFCSLDQVISIGVSKVVHSEPAGFEDKPMASQRPSAVEMNSTAFLNHHSNL